LTDSGKGMELYRKDYQLATEAASAYLEKLKQFLF